MAGGRTDKDLMLADSQTAAVNFGFHSGSFNVPKSKFLFYVQFVKADAPTSSSTSSLASAAQNLVTTAQSNSTALADWQRDLGFAVKTIDRPRVAFRTQTLNQYNRKRIVQTGHDFEPLQIKFHDNIKDSLNSMFNQYYQYYYGDSIVAGTGTSVYDVVTPEPYALGQWGFHPKMADQQYNYFFSHISVYQIFNGQQSQFDLVNPKIVSYNPDDFDYSQGLITNEISMQIAFEQIVYHETTTLDSGLLTQMGLTSGNYWDVDDSTKNLTYSTANGNPAGGLGNAIGSVLTQNLASIVTGQGGSSVKDLALSVANQYDANRGIAVGSVGVNSIKDLVSGNTQQGKSGIQGLLKGGLFGSPGSLF